MAPLYHTLVSSASEAIFVSATSVPDPSVVATCFVSTPSLTTTSTVIVQASAQLRSVYMLQTPIFSAQLSLPAAATPLLDELITTSSELYTPIVHFQDNPQLSLASFRGR